MPRKRKEVCKIAADSSGATSQIKDLEKHICELKERMDGVLKPVDDITRKIDALNSYAERYLHILGLIAYHGTVSPSLAVPDVKDSISRDIINVLAERKMLNVSQLTDAVRDRRGTASRRIIRDRLNRLVAQGYINIIRGKTSGKTKTYSLSEDVVRKWSQMLTGIK